MGVNAYNDNTDYKYKANGYSSFYLQYNGEHRWNTAASGSAGGTISFTQAMTLDASGDLQLGTTTDKTTSIGASGTGMTIGGSGSPNLAVWNTGNADWVLSFAVGNGGETYVFNKGNTPLIFGTNNTERARIDSTGVFLLGATAVDGIGGTPSDLNSTEIGRGYLNLNRDDTATAKQIQFGKNGVVAGYIQTGSTTTSYVTSSDARLKENIADAEDAGAKVDAIQVRQFNWKADGSHQDYGMVAQELMTVAPEAVSGDPESDEMMGVDYSKLVPMLVKEVQSLRKRVAELEAK